MICKIQSARYHWLAAFEANATDPPRRAAKRFRARRCATLRRGMRRRSRGLAATRAGRRAFSGKLPSLSTRGRTGGRSRADHAQGVHCTDVRFVTHHDSMYDVSKTARSKERPLEATWTGGGGERADRAS